jgi:hypothetical protein
MALAACSQPGSVQQATRAPDHDLVAAIRAAGAHDGSVVEIAPLRNPSIDGFLDAAHAAERAGDITQAISKTDSALSLAPDAPDILQYRAELAVRAKDYDTAESDARRSYELGPKLGGICARNWQTVMEIEQVKGHAAAAENARVSRERCHVDGPVRM